jgi:hypothetical protein
VTDFIERFSGWCKQRGYLVPKRGEIIRQLYKLYRVAPGPAGQLIGIGWRPLPSDSPDLEQFIQESCVVAPYNRVRFAEFSDRFNGSALSE